MKDGRSASFFAPWTIAQSLDDIVHTSGVIENVLQRDETGSRCALVRPERNPGAAPETVIIIGDSAGDELLAKIASHTAVLEHEKRGSE